MNFKENDTSKIPENILNDTDAMYLAQDKRRLKEAILKSDTEKFFVFTRMLRINATMKKAIIIHKNL